MTTRAARARDPAARATAFDGDRSLASRLLLGRAGTDPAASSVMSKPRRMSVLVLAVLLITAASAHETRVPTADPARFPARLLPPGELPALWIFVRAECPPCRRHVRALEEAMRGRDAATRARLASRIHVVGDVACTTAAQRHPRSWQRAAAVTSTPLTWWVATDTTIVHAWRGPRDPACWQAALDFALQEAP